MELPCLCDVGVFPEAVEEFEVCSGFGNFVCGVVLTAVPFRKYILCVV